MRRTVIFALAFGIHLPLGGNFHGHDRRTGRDRKASERKFYSRMALFLVVWCCSASRPSFYLRGIVPSYPRPNPTLPPAVILHGAVFTLWMALIVAQTS